MGLFSGPNPFRGFKALPVDRAPVRFLTREQVDALIAEASARSPDIHQFCALCVFAGMRTSEAAFSRWEWIDLNVGTLTVQGDGKTFTPKGRRFRSIPLADRLRDILEPHRQDSGYILKPEKTEIGAWRVRYEPKRAFKSVVEAARIPWCTPHILRHTFCSLLVQNGVSIYKVNQWAGHADMATTAVYAHLAPADADVNRI